MQRKSLKQIPYKICSLSAREALPSQNFRTEVLGKDNVENLHIEVFWAGECAVVEIVDVVYGVLTRLVVRGSPEALFPFFKTAGPSAIWALLR